MEIYRDDFEGHMNCLLKVTEPGKFTNLIMAFNAVWNFIDWKDILEL